jgi:glycosyltransferase involved in cell wall biosynthesis
MKIAIITQGRFHAFDLAGALLRRGHTVKLLTTYPKWAVRKFGLPDEIVEGFWLHGVLFRILHKLSLGGILWNTPRFLDPVFGRWAARKIVNQDFDIVHAFSGVALELLTSRSVKAAHLVVRGSAHIVVQDQLLAGEASRAHRRVERPSQTIVQRELLEYGLADCVVTLSSFAYDSFVQQGVPKEQIALLPLGVDVRKFRPTEDTLEARCQRILEGAPLRVLWIGTMSLQKGALDFVDMVTALSAQGRFQFRFVGTVPVAVRHIAKKLAGTVEFVPRRKQWDLPAEYAWGDVFIYPTIQDGFAVVLAQAAANALPIVTTPNSAGPDMIEEGKNGWIVPIRAPKKFVERLRWCDENRQDLADMVRRTAVDFVPRTWDEVALDFEGICKRALARKAARQCT